MKTLILMLISTIAFAVDTASVRYEYVIFYSSVISLGYSIDDFKIGKKSITDTWGQPGFMLKVLQPANTNYYDLFITSDAGHPITLLNNAQAKKCYYKKGYACLDSAGNVHFTDLRSYPPDWNRDFSIHESTP